MALVRRELATHAVSVRMEVASALPRVCGDRIELKQVLINLVMNGIEAMHANVERPRELAIRSSQVREHGEGRMLLDRDRSRGRPWQQRDGAHLHTFLHDKAERPGDGTVDLPIDHRGSCRPALGLP